VFGNTVDLGATVVGGADRVTQVAEIATQARYGEGSTPRSIGRSSPATKTHAHTTLGGQLITSNPMVCSPLRETGRVLRRNDTKV
jgi:hypothetical protein